MMNHSYHVETMIFNIKGQGHTMIFNIKGQGHKEQSRKYASEAFISGIIDTMTLILICRPTLGTFLYYNLHGLRSRSWPKMNYDAYISDIVESYNIDFDI